MSALRTRISELVTEHALPPGSAAQLRTLLDALDTDPSAPSTVTTPALAVEVHLADALDGLRLPVVRSAERIADLGAGAGFPGLALAVALPAAQISLVESVGKKVAFMQRAALAAGLPNAHPVHTRAEAWTAGLGASELVVARALAPLTALVEYAAPLLVDGGHLVAWKGARDPVEEADGEAAAKATGLALVDVVRVPPRAAAEHRHLHVYSKVRPTPSRFPRRPGIARKRPIQASTAA